jgi:hypothetical protein
MLFGETAAFILKNVYCVSGVQTFWKVKQVLHIAANALQE